MYELTASITITDKSGTVTWIRQHGCEKQNGEVPCMVILTYARWPEMAAHNSYRSAYSFDRLTKG